MNNKKQNNVAVAPKSSLRTRKDKASALTVPQENYLGKIYNYPLLTMEEELSLARQWRQHGSLEASYKLVTSHLRLVPKIAAQFKGYGLPMADLIAEGNLGLMHAVKKFDPDKGFRLTTYALWWIRAAIQEYILSAWSLVKIGTTASRRRLFFSLQSKKKRIEAFEKGDLRPDNLRKLELDFQSSPREITEVNRAIIQQDQSLNQISVEGQPELIELLPSTGPTPEEEVMEVDEKLYRRGLLNSALMQLKQRERDIFLARRVSEPPATLKELSDKYRISRERVRQIDVTSAAKVQKVIQELRKQEELVGGNEDFAL